MPRRKSTHYSRALVYWSRSRSDIGRCEQTSIMAKSSARNVCRRISSLLLSRCFYYIFWHLLSLIGSTGPLKKPILIVSFYLRFDKTMVWLFSKWKFFIATKTAASAFSVVDVCSFHSLPFSWIQVEPSLTSVCESKRTIPIPRYLCGLSRRDLENGSSLQFSLSLSAHCIRSFVFGVASPHNASPESFFLCHQSVK